MAGIIPTPRIGQETEPRTPFNSLDASGVRVHEVALQRWLNKSFFVASGYPTPVIFTSPMDAYSEFKQLWNTDRESSPFKYLFAAKNADGTPMYEPHPAPPKYPLISVKRSNWVYSPQRSQSTHMWRRVGWPSVSNDIKIRDLSTVYQSHMPSAWDYSFQIDHYCTRPDTHAFFINSFMRSMLWSGGTAQKWIWAVYPGFYDQKLVRIYLNGSIEDMTEEEPRLDSFKVYRASVPLIVEGWSPDPDKIRQPALWSKVSEAVSAIAPDDVDKIYNNANMEEEDLRPTLGQPITNEVLAEQKNLPPSE